MSAAVVVQFLQSAVVLAVAPLYAGVLARAEAVVEFKRGPSVLQPYRDLRKLLRKGSAVSDKASWVFAVTLFVTFACYLTVSVIVPVITNTPLPLAFLADLIGGAFVLALASFMTSLALLDTASPYGRAGCEQGELDRQHGRAHADPGVLHRRRGVRLRQPVPDEPRDLGLAVCAGTAHAPARATPVFERYLYQPVIRAVEWLADAVRPLLSGDVNLYLLYVFVAVLVAYLIAALGVPSLASRRCGGRCPDRSWCEAAWRARA